MKIEFGSRDVSHGGPGRITVDAVNQSVQVRTVGWDSQGNEHQGAIYVPKDSLRELIAALTAILASQDAILSEFRP